MLAAALKNARDLFFDPNRPAPNSRKQGPVYDAFMRDLPPIINGELSLSANYMVRGSAGDWKTYAYIPWVAIFDKQITTSALRGVYIVFLFSGDAKHVYLSLNQGFTFFFRKSLKERSTLE